MFAGLKPYSEEQIQRLSIMKPHHKYTMCLALRDVYAQVTDPEIRLRLRYVATLAKAMSDRLSVIDRGFLNEFYPTLGEYDKLMRGGN